jgi:hypothetical protein
VATPRRSPGTADIEGFLNDLVTRRRLTAASQNQALDALVFFYTAPLRISLEIRTLLG